MADTLPSELCCTSDEEEDFMAGGDLGEGFGRKPGGLYEAIDGTVARTLKLKKGSDAHGHYHLVKKGDDVSSMRCHGAKYSPSEDRNVFRPCTESYVRCRQNSIGKTIHFILSTIGYNMPHSHTFYYVLSAREASPDNSCLPLPTFCIVR